MEYSLVPQREEQSCSAVNFIAKGGVVTGLGAADITGMVYICHEHGSHCVSVLYHVTSGYCA